MRKKKFAAAMKDDQLADWEYYLLVTFQSFYLQHCLGVGHLGRILINLEQYLFFRSDAE